MTRGLHPKPNSNFENQIEQGSSAFGNVCCLILALIVLLFICGDASLQVTHAVHHDEPVNVLHYLGII